MCSVAAPVRTRDDLEIVTIRIVPVQAAAAIIVIDLERPLMHWIGPVAKPARPNALENRLELPFAHEKRIVLYGDALSRVLEIEGRAIVERHSPERTEARRRIAAQDLAEPCSGRFRITRG